MGDASIRFYAELNDFLAPSLRWRAVRRRIDGTPSVKDVVESCGVPHTEIDLLLVNGESVGFDHRLRGGEQVSVYPVFERLDIASVNRLRPAPLRDPRFAVDANLGRLASILRLLGFDTLYRRDYGDAELVSDAVREGRILLTRDRALLMRRDVTHGLYVRSERPRSQAAEVVARLYLAGRLAPYTRCAVCNGEIVPADPQVVASRVPPRTRRAVTDFHRCSRCEKVYWRGAHRRAIDTLVADLGREGPAGRTEGG